MPHASSGGAPRAQQPIHVDPVRNGTPSTSLILGDVPGFLGACDLLMQCKVFLGLQAAQHGSAIGFTVKDGFQCWRVWGHEPSDLAAIVGDVWRVYDDERGSDWGRAESGLWYRGK